VFLASALVSAIVLGIGLFKYNALQLQQQAVAEAIALGCAQELSRIVIEDPHFGFVSLTEQTGGTRTLSRSGESLPVHSINAILANIRLARLLALQFENSQLMDLTDKEFHNAQSTIDLLQKALDEAAKPESAPGRLARDVNGQPVDLYKKARQVYSHCLGQSDLSGTDFEIKLGQLTNGGPTISAAPLPEKMGKISKSQLCGSNYMSCVKIPCQGLNFVFAPVSSQTSLANVDSFRAREKNQLGSVLQLSIRSKNNIPNPFGATACAIPPAYRVSSSYATLVLDVPIGMSDQDVITFADFLKKDFSRGQPKYCRPENGDFPVDQNAQMFAAAGADNFNYSVGELIYDWLRSSNANSTDTLKSIVDIFNVPVQSPAEKRLFDAYCLALYFDRDAKVHRHLFRRNPFYKDFVAEAQISGESATAFSAGPARISFIDDVKNIGTADSGKHGGQPIDISVIDGPSILATNLQDEEAYERSLLGNAVLPPSDPLPYTLRFAGQLQVLSESAMETGNNQ
jgi:hypothetical protein